MRLSLIISRSFIGWSDHATKRLIIVNHYVRTMHYPSSITPKDPALPGLGWDKPTPGESDYFKTGRKTYWTDMITCAGYRKAVDLCLRCFGSCVFNGPKGAMVHDVIRGTVANVGIFNGFFATMHEAFGYGVVEGEA